MKPETWLRIQCWVLYYVISSQGLNPIEALRGLSVSPAIAVAAVVAAVCPGGVTPPSISANKRTTELSPPPIAAFAMPMLRLRQTDRLTFGRRRGRKHW